MVHHHLVLVRKKWAALAGVGQGEGGSVVLVSVWGGGVVGGAGGQQGSEGVAHGTWPQGGGVVLAALWCSFLWVCVWEGGVVQAALCVG